MIIVKKQQTKKKQQITKVEYNKINKNIYSTHFIKVIIQTIP